MKVGDLVRCTKHVAPTDFAGRLGFIVKVKSGSFVYPYEIKMLDDGDILQVSMREIELPETDPDLT